MHEALILVDIQNDFLPGGALAVPAGDEVIPIANRVQPYFDIVLATQDWHPNDHGSFAANHAGKQPGDVIRLGELDQILWPVHCVQNMAGAAFADDLNRERIARVFQKGIDRDVDSYSAFFDNAHLRATGLGDYLREHDVTDVYVMGLATDYCVKFTALDARELGFNTFVIEDGCRGVNLDPDVVSNSIEEMRKAGVHICTSDDTVNRHGIENH